MKQDGRKFRAEVPADYTQTRYPMSYYFAVDPGDGGIALYPGLNENLAGMPYFLIRQKEYPRYPSKTLN